ncbi:MAG: hypothetical protein AAB432_00790 [Patescibacteria group bacterium]
MKRSIFISLTVFLVIALTVSLVAAPKDRAAPVLQSPTLSNSSQFDQLYTPARGSPQAVILQNKNDLPPTSYTLRVMKIEQRATRARNGTHSRSSPALINTT